MNNARRALAAVQLLLVFPAALFITGAVVRGLQPIQYEPARTAQRIVDWYAGWTRAGLSVMLIALPLVVLLCGCLSLGRSWNRDVELRAAVARTVAAVRAHFATVVVAIATVGAGGILVVVVGHLITD